MELRHQAKSKNINGTFIYLRCLSAPGERLLLPESGVLSGEMDQRIRSLARIIHKRGRISFNPLI